MSLKKLIKRLLGITPPQPFPPLIPEKPKGNQPKKKVELPADAVMSSWGSDRQLQRKSVTDDQMNWEKIQATQVGKNDALTPDDLALISEKALDIAKANELKTHWAKGKSIAETVAIFEGRRGYSQRTIADYFATFSKAQK